MLIVSRKQNQKVMFPHLGIAVEILRIAGKTVRVGIEAPDDVRILRGELAEDQEFVAEDKARRHDLRNRLNSVHLALHLLQKQLDGGHFDEVDSTLNQAIGSLEDLDQIVAGRRSHLPGGSGKGQRALIVEDNACERELLAGYLRLCGYDVAAVEDGVAAMSHLESNEPPDVVLLDMQMPRMDGPETLAAIRSDDRFRDVKIFAVSGSDRNEIELPTDHRGFDKWFAKPLQPAEFAAQLRDEIAFCAG